MTLNIKVSIFLLYIRKSFQNDEEWRLYYCDSTLGCPVIQDLDLCKSDDLGRQNRGTKFLVPEENNLQVD